MRKTESSGEATHTWEYEYDTLGRLERATRDGQLAESYAYDAQGNRTAYRAPLRGIESTRAASFDAEDRALGTGEATCTYTPDGFVASRETSAGTTTFDYTGLGELERATLPDGREIAYRYDMSGRRVAKLVDGQIAERYEWADATRLLATYDGAGALTRRFLYADARTPYAFDTPAGRYFLAFDQTGSLRAVTDAAGAVVKRVEHDSFGNLLADSNPDFRVPLGFAGGLADRDTGLTLFGARDYDPVSGRWMAKDPIGFAGGDVNLFGYCLADPVNLVDPSGLIADNFDLGAFGRGAATAVAMAVVGVGFYAVVAVAAPVLLPALAVAGVLAAAYTGFQLGNSLVGVYTGRDSFGNCVSAEDASFGLGASAVGALAIASGPMLASKPVPRRPVSQQIAEWIGPDPVVAKNDSSGWVVRNAANTRRVVFDRADGWHPTDHLHFDELLPSGRWGHGDPIPPQR